MANMIKKQIKKAKRYIHKTYYVREIMEATGWKREKALSELNQAKQAGMPYFRYVKNKCWELNLEEIKSLNEKIEHRQAEKKRKEERKKQLQAKKENHIREVMEATGWDREKALSEMDQAKQAGMPYFRYVKNKCWELNLEEIKSLNEKIEHRQVEKKRKEERKQQLQKKKEIYIQQVMEATGWDREKALSEMDQAKQAGMPYFRYVKNKCWELNLEEIKKLNEEIEHRQAEKSETYILKVCEETGWPREKTIKELKQALHLGISNYQYAFRYLFQLTQEELQEFSLALKEKKKVLYRDNKFYVNMVCLKTGWDTDRAKREMQDAKKAGVSYLKYIQKQLWDSNNKEQVISELVKDKDRIAENKNTYAEKICEKTGWSRGKTELEVLKANVNCGASYEDYLVFKFYEKSPEEQREYVTLGLFNKMRIKYNDHYKSAANFDNKVTFNTNFKDYIKHKWFFSQDLSYENFSKAIEGLNKIIIKPLAATQGMGVEVHQCNLSESDNIKLYNHIIGLRESIVEEYIVQHDEVSKFCKSTVNTIRITTLNFNGDCRFLYSVFRIGKEGAAVDNFHAGGIAATIDISTGTVASNAADLDGNIFTHSPSTGQRIKGFKIPHWDIIISTCREITGLMEGTNLVGWDFAITDKGVDLIEGNPGASYIVAQIPNVEENIGIADKMVYPYLEASITGMEGWKDWIEPLCEKTGWSRDTASDKLQKAKEKGVSPYSYLKNECWRFTENEISEFGQWISKLQEKREEDSGYYVNIVCEKAGWTKEFARNRMNAAKNRGYSFRKFITMALWKLSDSEFDKLEPPKTPEKVQDKAADGGTDHSDSEIVDRQSLIMKEMNWSFGRLKIEALKSKAIAGTNFNEFYTYKLYRYPAEKGLEFITEEVHLKLQLRYCDYQGNEKYFDNKILFCKTFKDFIGRKWFETKDISFEQFQEKTKDLSSIICKKINGLGGKGIKKYSINHSEEDREIYNSLRTQEYIAEEYIEQHPAIAEFEPDTLNTIRIMSINVDGNCRILNAVIKLGTGDIVDNMLVGNSFVAGIDVDTGIICTDGVNKKGEVMTHHVNSGKQFRGFQIPCWEKLIETVKRASDVVEGMPYIGWDVAVKRNGEIAIIEGNHNQAGFLAQYPFAISEGIGKRDTVEPYWTF